MKVCLLLKTLMNARPSEKQGYSQMDSQLGNLGDHMGSHKRDGWAMEGKVGEEKGDKKAEIVKSRGHRRKGSQKGEVTEGRREKQLNRLGP